LFYRSVLLPFEPSDDVIAALGSIRFFRLSIIRSWMSQSKSHSGSPLLTTQAQYAVEAGMGSGREFELSG